MMQYKGYVGKVEFDAEAGLLHGEVLGIRDVVTFQGKSIAEIRRAFRESIDDYLAFCAKRGEQPDKPHSGKFVVRVGSDLHRRLDMLAKTSGKSLNTVVAELLERQASVAMPKSRLASHPQRPWRMPRPATASTRRGRKRTVKN